MNKTQIAVAAVTVVTVAAVATKIRTRLATRKQEKSFEETVRTANEMLQSKYDHVEILTVSK